MRKITSLFTACFCVFAFLSCRHNSAFNYELQKSSTSDKGMVVSAHPLSSEIGLEILKEGGNAADAAIAVQLALAVVYPRAGNIGGGGFLVYRDNHGEVSTLDYREKAPKAAFKDMFLDSSGQVINRLSLDGILAAAVPGTVAGLVETHQKYGRLQPWSRLVQPAIELAEKGFRITTAEADRLNKERENFLLHSGHDFPFVSRKKWKPGDRLVQKQLASTLRRIAKEGRDGFYSGPNAEAIVALCESRNGIITQEDLASYKTVWRKPLTNHWREYQIYSMGLPSSGGIVLGQILGMIDTLLVDSLGNRDVNNVHLIVEAERRAFKDRGTHLGDEDFYPVQKDSLLNKNYLNNKFADFDPALASPSQLIFNEQAKLQKESFETTHISIVDSEGNAASVTTTLNNNYGCKVWVPGGGYFLNDAMDDFSAKPGVPNMFGLIGGEANSIYPGKRMLSSMTPTIIEKNGKLWMVLGTPGGSTIMTSILQVFLNMAAFSMNIDQAVQETRYHHQGLPDEILYEKNAFTANLIQTLQSMGHSLKEVERIGLIEAIYVDDKGILHGAADRRSDDHASGW